MSSLTRSLVIVASISAGILTIGYFFIWRRGSKKSKKIKKEIKPPEDDRDMSILSTQGKKKSIKTSLEVTTSASLELNKKFEFTITKQANFFVEKIVEKMNDLAKENEEDNLKRMGNNISEEVEVVTVNRAPKISDKVKKYKEQENDGSYSQDRSPNLKKKAPAKNIKKDYTREEMDFRKSNLTRKMSINQNNTILNIVNDLKVVETMNSKIKQFARESTSNFADNQVSLYLPVLTNDIDDELDVSNDPGYLEEDDDDLKDLEGPFEHVSIDEFNLQGDLSDFMEGRHGGRARLTSEQIHPEKTEKFETAADLDLFLSTKPERRNSNINYNIQTEVRTINDAEKVEIIKEELLLIILKYLYTELHSGLIELSDKFVEQRRYYFETDEATYVSIINLFLRKKEEYFLGVLSEIMSRLTISQTLLDNSFVFYMNYADQDDLLVQQIKEAYDKVYKAGIKTTIAPKNLNKPKIKEILGFQCEKYAELMRHYKDMDMIEVMVIDYTYLEYGFDREAIKSAMNKFNIFESDSFIVYLNKLDDYQKNSFLNI